MGSAEIDRNNKISLVPLTEHRTAHSRAARAVKLPWMTFSGRLAIKDWGTVHPSRVRPERTGAGSSVNTVGSSRSMGWLHADTPTVAAATPAARDRRVLQTSAFS